MGCRDKRQCQFHDAKEVLVLTSWNCKMSSIKLTNPDKQIVIIYPNYLTVVMWLALFFLFVVLSITHSLLWVVLIAVCIYLFLNSLTSITLSPSGIAVHYAIKEKVILPMDDIRNFYRGIEKTRRGKNEYVTIRLKSNTNYYVFNKSDFWNYKELIKFLKGNITESLEPWPPKGSKYFFGI